MHTDTRPPLLSRQRLSVWILLGTLLSALLPLIICLTMIGSYSEHKARQHVLAQLRQEGDDIADELVQRLWFHSSAVRALINWTLLERNQPGASHVNEQRHFAQLQHNNPQFLWLALVSPEGKILQASNPALLGKTLPRLPRQQQQAEVRGPFPSLFGPLPGPRQQRAELLLFIPSPLLDSRWFVAALDWELLIQFLPNMLMQRANWPRSEMLLLDPEYRILFSLPQHDSRQLTPELVAAIRQADAEAKPVAWHHGQRWFSLMVPMMSATNLIIPDWQLVMRESEQNGLREWQLLEDKLVITALLALIVLSGLAYRLSRHLARPLETLQASLEDPAQQSVPEVSGYYEAWLLSRVLAELQTFEREQRLALASLNQTLELQVGERTAELTNVLQHATHAFISLDPQGLVISWNRMAEQWLGWSAEQRQGQRLPESMLSAEVNLWLRQWLVQLKDPQPSRVSQQREVQLTSAQGETIPAQLVVWSSQAGTLFRLNLILDDIRERKAAQQALQASRHQLQTITDNMPALIAYIDRDLRFQFVNATLRHWYGIEPSQAIGASMASLLAPEVYPLMRTQAEAALQGETRRFERTQWLHGQLRHLHTIMLPEHGDDGTIKGLFVLTQDITTRKQLELDLQQQAFADTLTGLPNRRAMEEQLPAALARADRTGHPLALLFMDLDGFKAVNDTWGHDAGDEVLRQFASRIRAQIRETDQLFRLAGDEFTLLLENLNDAPGDARRIADKILIAMQQPFCLDAAQVVLSSSIGIALHFPGMDRDAEQLLAAADDAMYRAKHSGKNRSCLAGE